MERTTVIGRRVDSLEQVSIIKLEVKTRHSGVLQHPTRLRQVGHRGQYYGEDRRLQGSRRKG
jgi:hypothetical protein